MPKFRKLCRKELESLHLSILRELGRQIGVRAPAAKNKEGLINDIISVQSGKVEPVLQSKFGAPPKIKIDISSFYENEDEVNFEYDAKPQEKPKFCDSQPTFEVKGVLDMHTSGYGFLRVKNYENSEDDVFVAQQVIKKYNLRKGDMVSGYAKKGNESAAPLQSVFAVNGYTPEALLERKNFDDLVPYYPTERIKLEKNKGESEPAMRLIDIFCPLGLGQRGLIVAPPKTGKTTLLKMIAKSIEKNMINARLFILLIDERPEEVTDIMRNVCADVIFSTFDENPEHHIRTAELLLNRAKRLVECGEDVIILMDSITRLARAYNSTIESSGKTLSGGIDPNALQGPKRFFGAARNIENGGSLTILSTALIETGSRMDDVIFEEFKGTGNMEIHLSRELSERRIFPAIDIFKSGTRKEELLLSEEELLTSYKLRKILSESADATDNLIEMLKKTKDNKDLLSKTDAWIKIYNKKDEV